MPRTLSKARALGYDKVLRKAQGQGPAPLQVPLEPEAASAFRHSNAIVTGYRVLLETREGRREHGRLYDRRFQDVDAGGKHTLGIDIAFIDDDRSIFEGNHPARSKYARNYT